MLKEADHLEKVKRVRLGEKEFAPLLQHYEVGETPYLSLLWKLTYVQAALNRLKDVYTRQS